MRGAAAPGGQRPPALATSGRVVARDLLPLPFVSAEGTAGLPVRSRRIVQRRARHKRALEAANECIWSLNFLHGPSLDGENLLVDVEWGEQQLDAGNRVQDHLASDQRAFADKSSNITNTS